MKRENNRQTTNFITNKNVSLKIKKKVLSGLKITPKINNKSKTEGSHYSETYAKRNNLRWVSIALNRIMEMSEALQNTAENKYMLNVSDH